MPRRPSRPLADPVGIIELTDRLGVPKRTGNMWAHRRVLPPPDYESVNGSQAWEWSTIVAWAQATNRWTTTAQAKERRRVKEAS